MATISRFGARAALMFAAAAAVFLAFCHSFGAGAIDEQVLFDSYRKRFDAVHTASDIEQNGFRIIGDHIFELEHENLGGLTLIPAVCESYSRLALFFAREDGTLALKTDDFASNSWLPGKARQTNFDIGGIAYRDLDGDGLRDIAVICICKNESGIYADKAYNVGDVLFQSEAGFYRDYRVSDKINRFDMNKNLEAVTELVRDGISLEFLFTAQTLGELIAGGFQPVEYLRVTEHLEKFGVVEIIPGFCSTVGVNYLMIYIADADGRILWNFQPMHFYLNFYSIREMSFKDIDGDGNKDLTVLGLYVTNDEDGRYVIRQDYDIYYQRAGYFLEDVEFKRSYDCADDDDIAAVTDRAARYWRPQP